MTDMEQEAQNEMFEIKAQLSGIRFKLLGLCSTFPPSAAWREIIECVLADAIEPAIRDLTTAAELFADRDEEHSKR